MAKNCRCCGAHSTDECSRCEKYTTQTNVGYWKNFYDGCYCSECNKRSAAPKSKCPSCGRVMVNWEWWSDLYYESPGFGISRR